MSELEALKASIATVNESLRTLQTQKGDPALIAAEKKQLGELKRQLGVLSASDGPSKSDAKKASRLALKTPKVSHVCC